MAETNEKVQEKYRIAIQEQGLLALSSQGEPKFTDTWFPYTSGEIGPYYIQSIAIANDGQTYQNEIRSTAGLIQKTIGTNNFDAIAGGETRDWDFSNPVAALLAKPHIKLYKNKKPIGDIEGKRIITVADLNNEGSSIRDYWYPQLTQKGGKVVHAFFYVDRLEDGVNVLKDLNLPNDSVIPFDGHAWQFLMDQGKVSKEVYTSLMARMEDKKAWAHNALRNHPEQLEKLLKDESTKAKGEKILKVGYPEIAEEVLALMKERGFDYNLE